MNIDFSLRKGDRVRHRQLRMTGIVMTVGAEKLLVIRSNGLVFNWHGRDLEKLDDEKA